MREGEGGEESVVKNVRSCSLPELWFRMLLGATVVFLIESRLVTTNAVHPDKALEQSKFLSVGTGS